MNNIHNVVWSPAKGSAVAVSELARVRGKGRSGARQGARARRIMLGIALAVAADGAVAGRAMPLPPEAMAMLPAGVRKVVMASNVSRAAPYESIVTSEDHTGVHADEGAPGHSAAHPDGANMTKDVNGTNGTNKANETRSKTARARTRNNDAVTLMDDGVKAVGDYIAVVGADDGTDAPVATGANAMAIGPNARSGAMGALAAGSMADAKASFSVALGMAAKATTSDSIAVGHGSLAAGKDSMAIGSGAKVGKGNGEGWDYVTRSSTAIGTGATVTAHNAVALGALSTNDRPNTVSVGAKYEERQITNVADGEAPSDAVTMRQLLARSRAAASGDFFVVNDSAGGGSASATGDFATGIGVSASASGNNAFAAGHNAKATQQDTTALGTASQSRAVDATAIGHSAIADASQSVALGANSYATRDKAVSVGSGELKRQIVNVAAGADDTDAVNVAQLKGAGLIDNKGSALTAITYAGSGRDTISFAGANGTQLKNLADGSDQTDAVTLRQLDAKVAAESGNPYFAALGRGDDGDRAKATGARSVAIGANSEAGSLQGVAVGYSSKSYGAESIALGPLAKAKAEKSTAIGYNATVEAGANNSVALGSQSATIRPNVVSVGGGTYRRQIINVADGTEKYDAVNVSQLGGAISGAMSGAGLFDKNGAALTAVTYTGGGNDAVSLAGANGTQLKNLADGVDAKDAVTRQQLDKIVLQGGGSPYLAVGNKMDGTAPAAASAAGFEALALGAGATGTGAKSIAAGYDAQAFGMNAVALGTQAKVGEHAVNSAAIGYNAYATGVNAVALGAKSKAARNNSVSVGSDELKRQITNMAAGSAETDAVNVAQLSGQFKNAGLIGAGGVALTAVAYDDAGKTTISLAPGGTQIKNLAEGVDASDAVTVSQLKRNSDAGFDTSGLVAYDIDTRNQRVTFGGVGAVQPVLLSNVADGVARNDAANVGQLNTLKSELNGHITEIGNRVTTIENASGGPGDGGNPANPGTPGQGGSFVNVSGDGPGGTGNGATANGVASVAVGGNAQVSGDHGVATGTNAKVQANRGVAAGNGASVTADSAVALGADSVADRANTVSVGAAGSERQITNVAAGVSATDAVNVGQLSDSAAQGRSYTDQRFQDTQRSISSVARNAYSGVAAAMAMPNLTPSGPGRTVAAVGVGNYKGYSAVAAGATYRSRNGNWLVNGAVSVTGAGDAGIRAQVGYEF